MVNFREKVLKVVKEIPCGSVLTYKQVAQRAGNKKAARAVGAILKTNYRSDIPCHRVIRSDGALGGYNRGQRAKRRKLREEGIIISNYSN